MTNDPVTFAIVKNGLDSIVDEIAYTIIRTARSEIVKDVMDFSAGLCDAKGRVLAQSKTIALHLGSIPAAISSVLERYGGELEEGDAVIINDPYSGGMHLPDIFMFLPIFLNGQIIGYSVAICHHTDVGGRVPGSNASDSTEIYQEGLRIAPLKLYEKGTVNNTLKTIIEKNVRVPDRVLGDLYAQYAACQVGSRQIAQLAERYGVDTFLEICDGVLDYAEQMTRTEIRQWPDGVYEFTDYVDDDGIDEGPFPIKVTLTVDGDDLLIDYEGTAPQVRGAINGTASFAASCAYASIACALDGDIPCNAGMFRAISVKVPKGSILNPHMPAAVAARALTGYRTCDALFGVLAQVVPHRIPAAGEGGNSVICLAGFHDDRSPFIVVDMINGAWGGRPNKDGVSGITNPSQNFSNTPVEVLEFQHPVVIDEYSLIEDSGGVGKWRGGMGVRRTYRVLRDTKLQLRSDRAQIAPYGLNHGKEGRKTANFLVRDGKQIDLPSKVTMDLNAGDILIHEQAGGGGFGLPEHRSKEDIIEDFLDDRISAQSALENYNIVV